MDNYSSGIIVTIIDLGLSRMDASPTEVHWTPFAPEVFEGEGDYQFDIYRMMRNHNNGLWKEYRPLTNVMVPTPVLLSCTQVDCWDFSGFIIFCAS
jgi:serine/threonine-protein kinase haspin